MSELQLPSTKQDAPQQWVHKANAENFRRWLQAPEGVAPFDFAKIFKALGYGIDITQRNLPPAVPCMLMAMVLAEAQDKEQVNRAAK